MGSILQRDTDERPLVPRGEEPPHQQSRAIGGNTSSENVPEKSCTQMSTAANRQSDSGSMHKQSEWDSLHPGDNPSQRAVDVILGERYPLNCTAFPEEGEYQSRCLVESAEGLLRLDAEPVDLSTDTGSLPVHRGRLVCDTTDLPAAPLLQLETRPTSRGNECLPLRL